MNSKDFNQMVMTCVQRNQLRVLKEKGETNRLQTWYMFNDKKASDVSEALTRIDDIF
jgi:hypothetical protein